VPDQAEVHPPWDLMWNSTIVYSMFANTIFSPQGDHMELYRVFPVDGRPDRAVMETSLYIPKPVETEDEKRHWDEPRTCNQGHYHGGFTRRTIDADRVRFWRAITRDLWP
jgi:hypothetical protein